MAGSTSTRVTRVITECWASSVDTAPKRRLPRKRRRGKERKAGLLLMLTLTPSRVSGSLPLTISEACKVCVAGARLPPKIVTHAADAARSQEVALLTIDTMVGRDVERPAPAEAVRVYNARYGKPKR